MHPNDGRVISNFIVQTLTNRDIGVHGDGSQTRSFCYVDDMTEALVRMMNGPDDFIGPVNLGNPNECSILQLAEMILSLTGSRSKITFKPLPQDDPIRRRPDITLAKERLNWEPTLGLEEGMKRTIEYFKEVV
jgi:UDP-glucuronate decarboxylase